MSTLVIPPQGDPEDLITKRENTNKLMVDILSRLPPIGDVEETFVGHAISYDRFEVPIYCFSKVGVAVSGPAPAIVYTHGGGYFCLSVEIYRPLLQTYVSMSGVPIYAMDYRLPPEHPFPAPVEDCYAALKHVYDNAEALNVDPRRIIIMGDSAGGGLCAGTAILARDRGIPLAKQMVLNGNLDNRTVDLTAMPELAELATWGIEDNIIGWEAYLGKGHELSQDIPPCAAASRLEDFTGLASLYLDVPSLDILRDEGMKYATKAAAAGVQVELHVYPGVPHGFELSCPGLTMAKMVMENRVRAITSIA